MATHETVLKVFKMLSRAYPDYTAKNLAGAEAVETMRLYERAMEDMPDTALEAATLDHITSSQWWPKISELRERATGLLLNDLALPTAAEAWGMVVERLRKPATIYRDGQHYRLRPMAPLIEKTVHALGGWSYLRTSENSVADRARFLESYDILALRERRRVSEHPAVADARAQIAASREPLLEVTSGNSDR